MIIQVFCDPMSHPFVVHEGCADEFARSHKWAGQAVDYLKYGSSAEFARDEFGESWLLVKNDLNEKGA